MLNAVGIDVSKGKSTVAILQPEELWYASLSMFLILSKGYRI